MLNLTASKYVFLAADDDYIIKSNLIGMIRAMERERHSISSTSMHA